MCTGGVYERRGGRRGGRGLLASSQCKVIDLGTHASR